MSLSKRSSIIMTILVVIAITAFIVYRYAMQPPTTIESKEVDFTGSSDTFLAEIQKDISAWQDNVVVLTGIVTQRDENGITLSSRIYCQFRKDVNTTLIKEYQEIRLKGRVIGYDDLLDELKLDQCIIQQ